MGLVREIVKNFHAIVPKHATRTEYAPYNSIVKNIIGIHEIAHNNFNRSKNIALRCQTALIDAINMDLPAIQNDPVIQHESLVMEQRLIEAGDDDFQLALIAPEQEASARRIGEVARQINPRGPTANAAKWTEVAYKALGIASATLIGVAVVIGILFIVSSTSYGGPVLAAAAFFGTSAGAKSR
jgi:hypothetical protein